MNVKISELSQVNELYPGCCFPIVQNGETKKVSFETLGEMLGIENNSIDSITTSIVTGEDGTKKHIVTINLTDGTSTTFEVSDGATGPQGPAGPEGKEGQRGKKGDTPVRGVDYWTAEDVAAIRAECEAMVEEQTAELQNEVDQLKNDLDNVLISGEAEGENITLTDSAEYHAKVSPLGESTQETRNGKNLFNKTNIKFVVNGTQTYLDGIYTITPNGNGNVALDINIDLPAGTYSYSGNGSDTTQIRNSNDTTIANNISGSNQTFTLAEEGSFIRFNWATGTSTDPITLDTNNIQIEKGTEATAYEPYGAMPSPDYPSEIESVTSPVVIKSTGKNLYNVNNPKTIPSSITVDEDGWITCNYDNTDGKTIIYINYYTPNLELKTGTPYNIITEIKEFSGNFDLIVFDRWGQFEVGKTYYTLNITPNSIYTDIGRTKDEFTSDIGLATSVGINAGSNVSITFRISVIQDTSVTADTFLYEPYKESITSIPLLHPMRSLPNGTRDRIYYEDGKWYDEQKVIEKIVTRNESNWYNNTDLDTENTKYYQCNISGQSISYGINIVPMLSNYFKCDKSAWSKADEERMSLQSNNGVLMIKISKTVAQTLGDLKNWLDEHELKIQYELAKPIITEITDEDTIKALESVKTYKGITNITADGPITVDYKKDLETLFNNLQTQILANEEV